MCRLRHSQQAFAAAGDSAVTQCARGYHQILPYFMSEERRGLGHHGS